MRSANSINGASLQLVFGFFGLLVNIELVAFDTAGIRRPILYSFFSLQALRGLFIRTEPRRIFFALRLAATRGEGDGKHDHGRR